MGFGKIRLSNKTAPAVVAHPGTTAKEVTSLTNTVYRTDERARMVRILQEADERYRRELMDEEERLLLRERILRLKKRLAASA